MPPFLLVVCVLLAAAAQQRDLGLAGDGPNLLLGFVALGSALAAWWACSAGDPAARRGATFNAASQRDPTAPGPRTLPRRVVGGSVLLCGLLAWIVAPAAARPFALPTALAGAALARRGDPQRQRLLHVLIAFALLYAVYATVRDHLPLWWLLERGSRAFSAGVSGAFGQTLRLGPEYLGTDLATIVALYLLTHLVLLGSRRWLWSVLALATVALAVVLKLALRTLPAWWAPAARQPWLAGRDEPIVLFALLLLPLWWVWRAHPFARTGEQPEHALRQRTVARAALAGVLASAVGAVALVAEPHVAATGGRVQLCTRGAWSRKLPVWGTYGSQALSGANASTLPVVLRDLGFKVTEADSLLDDASLAQVDALFVMDLDAPLSEAETQAVWRFVARGGGLLVLGDHTDIQHVMAATNPLLAPVGVRLAFDSAIPFVPRWTWYNAMRLHPHPVLRGLDDESDIKVSVGASVEAPPGARPLLSGRLAFSDAGNRGNSGGAFLGNMQYDAGEPAGDIPLAVEVRHGRGKAVVFGDTSPFQMTSATHVAPLIGRLFQYLCQPAAHGPSSARRALGALLLLAGVLAVVVASARRARLDAWVTGTLAATAIGSALVMGVCDLRARVAAPAFQAGAGAYIDLAHGNRVDVHTGQPNGTTGITLTLLRAGLLPQAHTRFDATALRRCALAVEIAPAFPLARGEIAALRRYVEEGGNLIVAAGYEERNGSRQLLEAFGYAVGRTPIGAAHAAVCNVQGHYATMHESWPVERPGDQGEVLVSSWGYPLIVLQSVGRGHLLVIGDTFFLLDCNTENNESFNAGNLLFIRAVLERMLGHSLPAEATTP